MFRADQASAWNRVFIGEFRPIQHWHGNGYRAPAWSCAALIPWPCERAAACPHRGTKSDCSSGTLNFAAECHNQRQCLVGAAWPEMAEAAAFRLVAGMKTRTTRERRHTHGWADLASNRRKGETMLIASDWNTTQSLQRWEYEGGSLRGQFSRPSRDDAGETSRENRETSEDNRNGNEGARTGHR